MNPISGLKFIRKGGKIIPIGALRGGAFAKRTISSGARATGTKFKKQPDVKPRQGLRALGFGLAVASGVLGAATFSGGSKKVVGGAAGGLGLDVASSAANVAAYAGKGNGKERTKAALRQEGINASVGWGIYGAGLIGMKQNRTIIKAGVKKLGLKAASFLRRV